MSEQPIALFLFDLTGVMARPWADAGVLCYCVDIQHKKGIRREGNIVYVGVDIRHWLPPSGLKVFCACFPPCTHLAVSGSRWFKGKGLRLLSEAIELFAVSAEVCEWAGCAYMIENPVSTISSYWRKPDFAFDPADYGGYLTPPGDAYTKKTCLWTGGGFVMPQPRPVDPIEGSKMHMLPPSEDRANLRSATPAGFARAVFEANGHVLADRREAA